MKFVEIVETVESIETKVSTLSEAKLGLLETILEEGAGIDFDAAHHMDYLIEFVDAQSDSNAEIIAETVNGGEVLEIILESVRKNPNDVEAVITESTELVGEIDIDTSVVEDDSETASVTLLSIVTNTLTEMLGEEAVEALPAEMVFDIVEEAKNLELSDDAADMDIVSLVEEISTKLEDAITEGTIDVDSEDYEGETLAEFLDDYSDTEDLLEEMAQVNEEILAEAEDQDGANLMRKAKESTSLVEAKMEKCASGDMKCKVEKAKKAKAYFAKNELPGGGKAKDFSMDKISGKLAKHVKAAAKASKAATGKPLSKEYIQYVLVPGIIKRMRMKNKRLKAKDMKKKQGMR
jgi:hypothetical protein